MPKSTRDGRKEKATELTTNADVVSFSPPMPSTPLTDLTLPDRRKWPKLSEQDQATISDFLNGHKLLALKAIETTIAMLDIDPSSDPTRANLEYWKHIKAGLDWMLSRVPQKHQYLAMLEAIKRHEQGN